MLDGASFQLRISSQALSSKAYFVGRSCFITVFSISSVLIKVSISSLIGSDFFVCFSLHLRRSLTSIQTVSSPSSPNPLQTTMMLCSSGFTAFGVTVSILANALSTSLTAAACSSLSEYMAANSFASLFLSQCINAS